MKTNDSELDGLRAILYAIEHTGADRNEIHKIAREALGVPCGDGERPSATSLQLEVDDLRRQVALMREAMIDAEVSNCGLEVFPSHAHKVSGKLDWTNEDCPECARWNAALGRIK